MIKFFRHIRQQMITQNRFTKYIFYAIGEILLVVIGILIALQVNNWNEAKTIAQKVDAYKSQLKVELEGDLEKLEAIENRISKDEAALRDYVNYYNQEVVIMDTLNKKRDVEYQIRVFSSQAYTIEEIVNNGFLSFLEPDEKRAILELKAEYNIQAKYYDINTKDLANFTNAVNKELDVLFFYGYSEKQHDKVKNWQYDINSKQMRLINNEIAAVLTFYGYQKMNHANLKKRINEALAFL